MADDLDELSKSLFGAARAERAAPEARSRALRASLAAAREETPSRVAALVATAALAAGVAGLLWFGEREAVTSSIDREPLVPTAPGAARPRERAEAQSPSPAVSVRAVAPSVPVARSASTPRVPATLSEELALLENARAALASGASGRALEFLDRYRNVLRGTRLAAEATMLRIEALAASGRASEAAELARAFVKENPGSPLVDRARAFTGETNADSSRENSGRTP